MEKNKVLSYLIFIEITWYEPNSRRDIDNITIEIEIKEHSRCYAP